MTPTTVQNLSQMNPQMHQKTPPKRRPFRASLWIVFWMNFRRISWCLDKPKHRKNTCFYVFSKDSGPNENHWKNTPETPPNQRKIHQFRHRFHHYFDRKPDAAQSCQNIMKSNPNLFKEVLKMASKYAFTSFWSWRIKDWCCGFVESRPPNRLEILRIHWNI